MFAECGPDDICMSDLEISLTNVTYRYGNEVGVVRMLHFRRVIIVINQLIKEIKK